MNVPRAWMITPLFLLAGCQTWGPTWSEVSGARHYNLAIAYRQPAVIEKIDGQSAFAARPIKLEPGHHEIVISGVPPRPWPGGGNLTTISLDTEPCKLYYINAQYATPTAATYEPVIDYVETVAGCKPTA
jgi:hypothetical protein